VMMSTCTKRKWGFQGFDWDGLSYADRALVNNARQEADKSEYVRASAARTILGSVKKQKLTSLPFTRMLDFGENKQGWWDADWTSLQLEDCLDVMHVLYPELHIIFELDHSAGHLKKLEGGFAVLDMEHEERRRAARDGPDGAEGPELLGPVSAAGAVEEDARRPDAGARVHGWRSPAVSCPGHAQIGHA